MSTDYTHAYADRLRAVTVAGEIANLIKQLNIEPELIQAAVAGPAGAQIIKNCGLTTTEFDPLYAFTIAAGNSATSATVCSQIAQTVVATAEITGDACLATVSCYWDTVISSTQDFEAGDCHQLVIVMNFADCTFTEHETLGSVLVTLTASVGGKQCITTFTIPIIGEECYVWVPPYGQFATIVTKCVPGSGPACGVCWDCTKDDQPEACKHIDLGFFMYAVICDFYTAPPYIVSVSGGQCVPYPPSNTWNCGTTVSTPNMNCEANSHTHCMTETVLMVVRVELPLVSGISKQTIVAYLSSCYYCCP